MDNKTSKRIYDISEIQKVYKQHNDHFGTVIYSYDGGYTWQTVPVDSGKWHIQEWVFAFIFNEESELSLLKQENERLKETVSQQDQMIGSLTREKNWLQDSVTKRQDWLREAKKQAGYDDSVSFDGIWNDVLETANKLYPVVKENESLKRDSKLDEKTIVNLANEVKDLKREVREFAEWYSQSDFIYDSFNKRWEDSEGYIKTYEQLRELYKCK